MRSAPSVMRTGTRMALVGSSTLAPSSSMADGSALQPLRHRVLRGEVTVGADAHR